MEFIRPDTQIDFMGQSRLLGIISLVLVVVFLALMIFRGFNLGIEFAGGTLVHIALPEEAAGIDEGVLRSAMSELGFPKATIVRFGAAEEREFRITVRQSEEEQKELAIGIIDGLTETLGVPVQMEATESIGPRVGEEMRRAGFGSVALACFLILIYVWFRFDLRYAPGAVVALLHDVIITAGVFALFQLEFNLQVLAALLVVIGYSLNDTIVIYDRIRENLELRGTTHLEDVVNQSINQTLSRTILTSLTTLIVVVALLVLGGPVVRDFALALIIGVTVGTYSTIYVASALLVQLERYWGAKTPVTASS
jgi:preprotein translocase subunit SecF